MTDTPPPTDDLVERLTEWEEVITDFLAHPGWRPSRAHIEAARNKARQAASELARLRQKLEDAEAARDSAIDRAAFRARVYLMGCGLHYETADGATRAVLNLKEDAGAKDDWLAALTLAQSQRDALAKASGRVIAANADYLREAPHIARQEPDELTLAIRALASARAQAMGE